MSGENKPVFVRSLKGTRPAWLRLHTEEACAHSAVEWWPAPSFMVGTRHLNILHPPPPDSRAGQSGGICSWGLQEFALKRLQAELTAHTSTKNSLLNNSSPFGWFPTVPFTMASFLCQLSSLPWLPRAPASTLTLGLSLPLRGFLAQRTVLPLVS